MRTLTFTHGEYHTPQMSVGLVSRTFPSLTFYVRFLRHVFQSSSLAKRGRYGYAEWSDHSLGVLHSLERSGVNIEITGMEHVEQLEGPCVFVANHVSMLETVTLPGIICPIKKVTFVVKQSLLEYPVFRHVMRSRDPIPVTRTNPREDFKAVLDGGVERLHNGISIIIFPQTSRTPVFEPEHFNTIGIKLAKRADVPVIPLALLTDAWENGFLLKDFGKIQPSRKVYFAFGTPIRIQGRGDKEHEAVIEFITNWLHKWQERDA